MEAGKFNFPFLSVQSHAAIEMAAPPCLAAIYEFLKSL
jgi:hypothetical protein